jgi:hypothetical protein
MTRTILLLLVACSAPPRPQPPPPAPTPAATVVEYEVHGEMHPVPAGAVEVEKNQAPHVKLKLGHFRNDELKIGVTIDLLSAATDSVADIDPAKLRFDGEQRIWLLQGRHGSHGRIDYVREGERVMLQISRHNVTVWIPDPEDRPSTAVELYRDGDADPL